MQIQIQQGQKQLQDARVWGNECQQWIMKLEIANTKYQKIEEESVDMMVRSAVFEQCVIDKEGDADNIWKFQERAC